MTCLLALGCSTVKMHRVRDDWETVDKARIKRLAVVLQPLPDGSQKVGEAWARIARRYVNQKRDFLVKAEVVQPQAPEPAHSFCDGVDGLLWLEPTLVAKGEGFEARVKARLLRCADNVEVWAADAGGSFGRKDERLTEVAAVYAREFGAEVEPYVAAAMNLLRPTLDTLPQPALTDEDITEKMGLDE